VTTDNDDDVPPALRKLSPAELVEAQRETLAAPRRAYAIAARVLFAGLDLVYGRRRTLTKFKMLELIARVPYQAWEQVAYVATTHTAADPGRARRIFGRVEESRSQQDNEQWHLLILEELTQASLVKEGFVRARLLPQVVAFVYYQLSWLLYVVRPRWSYRLNADFEDHAEHEYMLFVEENPDLETTPVTSELARQYGTFDSLADLFRQIGHDERVHKEESLAAMKSSRFG
jgi:ubiquinol oxidase